MLGVPAAVGDRAFEVLAVLVQSAGELVTKEALMRRVWSSAVVEENTLEVHVSALRKALGPDRGLLKTSYARGYRLFGDWTAVQDDAPAGPSWAGPAQDFARCLRNNLPTAASGLIGRAAAVQRLCDLLSAHRAVTLTGVGGIGKTRLALEAAHRLAGTFGGDVWFVELASLSDPGLVPSAVARVLGLKLIGDETSVEAVARMVGERKMLLVLDNCEHVVDAAAALTETMGRLCPRSTVLATSREALRVDGEHIYQVPALDLPPPGEREPSRLLGCGAAELFLARLRALDPGFSPKGDDALAIAEICRHLDGIPLAIEFAVGRAATIGAREVAAGLTDRFGLLTVGRRAALPRHRTLRAALDWSYDLLPEDEAAVLRCLAVFAGDFPLDAAMAVVADVPGRQVVDRVASLVAKSLVVADLRDAVPHYRLLETVRVYASEKLRASGGYARAARRHAEHYRALSSRAEAESGTGAEANWLVTYVRHLDNWRAALDWAFSPDGDAEVGVALTLSTLPIWFKLALMGECRGRVEQALAATGPEPDPRATMRLSAALAAALFYTEKGASPEVAAVWETVLTIADRLDDVEHRLWARWGLWLHQMVRGAFREALASARGFCDLAVEPADAAAGDRMLGFALHFLGEQAQARRQLEASLARRIGTATRPAIRVPYDQGLATRAYLPRVLWLQGFPDRAARIAADVARDAREGGHWVAFAVAIVQAACPVALLTGDLRAAEDSVAVLIDKTTVHGLGFLRAEGRCYEGILRAMRGDVVDGLRTFRMAVRELSDLGTGMNLSGHLAAMAAVLAGSTEAEQGPAMVGEALALAERDGDRWCMPELLRLRGEFLLRSGAPDAAAEAEAQFRQSLDWAGRQGALSWELRAATSLARMMRDQNRVAEARAVLAGVYQRFSEGFGTADLLGARQVLEAVG